MVNRNRRNHFIGSLVLLAMVMSFAVFAGCTHEDEFGELSGYVYEEGDPNTRLAGVTVFLVGRKVVTGSDGTYSFTEIPVGQQELVANKVGFQTYTTIVRITSDPNAYRRYSFGMSYE